MDDITSSVGGTNEQPGGFKSKHYIKHLRWYIAGLLLLATTVGYLDRQTLSIAAPVLRKKFNMSDIDYSHIVMAFLLSYAIMQPIAGRIIDWLGTRRGFSLAIIWWATANILHSLATGVKSFSFFRFLLGMGEGGMFPAAIKTVSEWFPAKERATATGVFNTGAGIGALIAPPLIGVVIIKFGWQWAFITTGLFDLVWVTLWLWLYRNPEIHPRLNPTELNYIKSGQVQTISKAKGTWKELLPNRSLWGCAIARFLADPVWWFYIFWLPQYFASARGFNIKEIALFLWLPFLTADFGSFLGGMLSSFFVRRGVSVLTARKIALCICASLMPVALFAVRAQNPYLALACISIATFGHQAWSASLLTLPADLFPKHQVASAYGMTGSAGAWGGVLFTWLIGIIVTKFGYTPVFTMVGLMHPVGALLVLILVTGKKAAFRTIANPSNI
jgi:ACS family hexuronate transporter-like MFS transporter